MKQGKSTKGDQLRHQSAAAIVNTKRSSSGLSFEPPSSGIINPAQLQLEGGIQMKEMEEEELMAKPEGEEIQMKELEEEELLQGSFQSPIQRETEQSSPNGLPGEVNAKMESTLGADFSGVKIHPNSSKAPEVGARAYTQGSDIHFAPGQFQPETTKGQALIGHELTHVVQQREDRVKPTTQVKGMSVNDDPGLEKEADQMGKKASS